MVLRKPYAFLIKHFKLVHLVLMTLMTLFFIKMRNIIDFFDQYIAESVYGQISGVVGKYIGIIAFFLPFLIIGLIIVITSLLKMKSKPIKYYIFTILMLVIETIVMFVAYMLLNDIELGEVNPTFLGIFRDLMSTISYLIIPFIAIALVRGVGFNVKQFNFKKDLIELDITDEDSEEFEVEVEVDTENIKAKINRKLRFVKYVYLENKIVFWVIGGIFVFGIILSIFNYIISREKIYKENETFSAYSLNLKVKNTYKTNKNSNNEVIRNDKFYIIVDLEAINKTNVDLSIPYENIYIRVNKNTKFSPTDQYVSEFADFGTRFVSSNKVKKNTTRQMILVYEIDSKYYNSELRFEYLVQKAPKGEDLIYDYAKVKINPKELNDTKVAERLELGNETNFSGSFIEGTKLKINSAEFNKRYSYKYKKTIGGIEREFSRYILPTDTSTYQKTILRLEASLEKNTNLNQIIYNDFYSRFVTIEYLDGVKLKKQKAKIIDLTPGESKYVYLEVVKEVSEAKKVILVFTIRDKEYRYVIVNKE